MTDNRLLYDQLCDIVGMDNVSKAEAVREQYGRDESHFKYVLNFLSNGLNPNHQ